MVLLDYLHTEHHNITSAVVIQQNSYSSHELVFFISKINIIHSNLIRNTNKSLQFKFEV